MSVRRHWVLGCALALAFGLVGCGVQSHPTNADANNDGTYVDAGPVTYQLQISRELNPFSTEDSQYITGLPRGTPEAKPDELWYGVFLQAWNQGHESATTSDHFAILDTEGNTYYPIPLNPAENAYAWKTQTLQPSGTEPAPNTTASFGPTQGGLILFKLNNVVYSNRPLELLIFARGQTKPSTISLDL